jgi:hypothetical protein
VALVHELWLHIVLRIWIAACCVPGLVMAVLGHVAQTLKGLAVPCIVVGPCGMQSAHGLEVWQGCGCWLAGRWVLIYILAACAGSKFLSVSLHVGC